MTEIWIFIKEPGTEAELRNNKFQSSCNTPLISDRSKPTLNRAWRKCAVTRCGPALGVELRQDNRSGSYVIFAELLTGLSETWIQVSALLVIVVSMSRLNKWPY